MARRMSVTPASQRRKNTVHGFFNLNPMDEVETEPENGRLPLFHCGLGLYHFTKRIKQLQMDDREWELLRATPFGRLIENILKIEMNVETFESLLSFWDEEHCGFVIGGSTIPFTVDDIALITGLPNRGRKVQRQTPIFKCDPEFNRIFMTTANIDNKLGGILQSSRDSPNSETNKRFVQHMILYLWGCVLFPPSCRIVPKYLSCYVQNLEVIGSFNWAEYLHIFLVKEINAKSKLLKLRNEGKELPSRYTNGPWFAINVWFFEHVDFGEDSRPSNPDVRPRMLKWVGCKMWERKPFLQRLREIVEDKVSYRIIPKNDELELVSLENVDYMAYQIFQGSCDAVRGDPYQHQTTENMGSGIKVGCEEACQRGRESEEEKKPEKDYYSELKQYISVLVRRIDRLERLAASKGWEIEEEMNGMDDLCEHKDGEVDKEARDGKIDGEVKEQVVCHLNEAFQESCIEGDVGLTVEKAVQPNLIEINVKHGYRKRVKRKVLKSLVAKEHLVCKRRRDVDKVQTSIPIMRSLASFERKDADILVNLDDYASPSELKKLEANVVPLNYVGRELLTGNERRYLDDFCIKPMQRDDIVFFNWNIAIRRHSMVGYLQGGYTGEEIIDAYARSLFNKGNMSGDNFASFLYVPPMFLGLYRNKLSSYKTFLNLVDKNSLKLVKFLLLPCLISTANHWLLLVCDLEIRRWTAYDSLYDPRHRGAAKEQIKLLEEYLYHDHGFNIKSWILEYNRIYPQQEPGTLDCGVFVMKFIENIMHFPRKISFRGTDMKLFRPQIAYKILCHC